MRTLIIICLIAFTISDNASSIKNHLLNHGFTKAGVAGIMGNLYVKSKFNPKLYQLSKHKTIGLTNEEYIRKTNDGTYKNFVTDRAGFGIAFWTYHQRKRALLEMCKGKIGDLHCQLNFLVKEIRGQKKLYSILTTTKDVNTACDRVLIDFEKAKNYKKQINNRRSFCRRYL